jgi:hypothetical protein
MTKTLDFSGLIGRRVEGEIGNGSVHTGEVVGVAEETDYKGQKSIGVWYVSESTGALVKTDITGNYRRTIKVLPKA